MRVGKLLRRLFFACAFLFVAMGATNAVVDPYGIFGWVHAAGFNAKKVHAHNNAALAKQQRALSLKAQTALIGNGLVDAGLDPASSIWPQDMRPIANLGLPDGGMGGVTANYSFAVNTLKATTLFIGLDFADFLPSRDQESFNGQSVGKWQSMPSTILSPAALVDSIRTVMAQDDPYSASMTAFGFNPMRDRAQALATSGHHALAQQQQLAMRAKLERRAETVFSADGGKGKGLQLFDRLLETAAINRVRVVFFVYPQHAQSLQAIEVAGRWSAYEDWKRALVRQWTAARVNQPAWQTALWDFGVLAPMTEEAIPAQGDLQSNMTYWWEMRHFKAALGKQMLLPMLGKGGTFGVRLSAASLEGHLADQRIRLANYTKSHPANVAGVRDCGQPDCSEKSPDS